MADPARPSPPSSGGWLPQLDGLRGMAALAVAIGHFWPGRTSEYWIGVPVTLAMERFAVPSLGVICFFVLSAFLLTYLAVHEHDRRGGISAVRFYERRIFRIWPLYGVVLLVTYWLASPSGPLLVPYRPDDQEFARFVGEAWMYATFLFNWGLAFNEIGGHRAVVTYPSLVQWSIAVEEQFYLFYPWLIAAVLPSRRRGLLVALGLLGLGMAFRTAFMLIPTHTAVASGASGIYFATLSYVDVLLMGGLAGWLAARKFERAPWLVHLLKRPGAGLVLVLGIVLIGWGWRPQIVHPYAWYTPVIYPAAGAVFAGVILWVLLHPAALVSRALSSGPARLIGTLSFGVYLWHPVVLIIALFAVRNVLTYTPLQANLIATTLLLLYLAGTFAVAAFTYGLVERPALLLKHRLDGNTGSMPVHLRTPLRAWLTLGAAGTALALVPLAAIGWLVTSA